MKGSQLMDTKRNKMNQTKIRMAARKFRSSYDDKKNEQYPTYLVVPPHYYYTGGRWTKYKREHDTQRQKIYDSEYKVFGNNGGIEFDSIKELKMYFIKEIWMDEYFQLCFRDHPYIKGLSIQQTWGSKGRYYNPPRNEIRISKDRGFHQDTLLHELTHCLVPRPFSAHGPLFAVVYLDLILNYMGKKEAKQLMSAYEDMNVRYYPYEEFQYDFNFGEY